MDAVETLREAVRRAEATAKAATPGPWFLDDGTDTGVYTAPYPTDTSEDVASAPRSETERHIASWHPKVALAVAMIWHEVAYQIAENDLPESDPIAAEAIAAARAFLGEVA